MTTEKTQTGKTNNKDRNLVGPLEDDHRRAIVERKPKTTKYKPQRTKTTTTSNHSWVGRTSIGPIAVGRPRVRRAFALGLGLATSRSTSSTSSLGTRGNRRRVTARATATAITTTVAITTIVGRALRTTGNRRSTSVRHSTSSSGSTSRNTGKGTRNERLGQIATEGTSSPLVGDGRGLGGLKANQRATERTRLGVVTGVGGLSSIDETTDLSLVSVDLGLHAELAGNTRQGEERLTLTRM